MIEETRTVLIEKTDLYDYAFFCKIKKINKKLKLKGRYVDAYIIGEWLRDKKLRRCLMGMGFDIYDAMDTKDHGYIKRFLK